MNLKNYAFPILLLLCNLGAAVGKFREGEWKLGVYWLCCGVCVAMVGFTRSAK